VRSYLAIGGGLLADDFLGSGSTYLPASFGGYRGRALRDNDELEILVGRKVAADIATPEEFRPPVGGAWVLRACRQKNFIDLSPADQAGLYDSNFSVSARSDRMGMQLQGRVFDLPAAGYLDSAPIFPGCVQCPSDGQPYLLSVDAQTTGGYAQLAQVARVDRHLIGQLRSGDHLRFLERTSTEAAMELREKHDYWRAWLPDIASII
jgi:allophanate hydrolase